MFIHFSPRVWQDHPDGDDLATPLEQFNPAQLDTEQWAEAAVGMGAHYVILVAKHGAGFCLWQTESTDYGVRSTPWRAGKGDVLADLAASCRKRGLRLGVYVCPHDSKQGAGNAGRCAMPEAQAAYDRVFRRQMTEVLSRYGEMVEIWFDGSLVIDIGDILARYAPRAMVFQSQHATIRWVGNEEGATPYPSWNAVRAADAASGISTAAHGDPDGEAWMPIECDARIHADWFWGTRTDKSLKSVEDMMAMYYRTVGRGAVLLLNQTPDTSGLIPALHVRRGCEFGAEVRRRFGQSVAETAGEGDLVELALPRPMPVDHVAIMEDIRQGERVREYTVEGLVGGTWRELCRGTAIGHKKIDAFAPAEVARLRWRAVRFAASPRVRRFAAFHTGLTVSTADVQPVWVFDQQRVGGWSIADGATGAQAVTCDLTAHCHEAGQYEVVCRPAGGTEAPLFSDLILDIEGTALPEYIRATGRPDVYSMNVPGVSRSLRLRLSVSCPAGRFSSGDVSVRRVL